MEIFLLTLLVVFASLVGTVTGFGSSTVMLPVMLMFYPYAQSLLLTALVHIFVDIWKLILFRRGVNWRLVMFFGIPGMIFSIIGSNIVFDFPETIFSRVLGAILFVYAIILLNERELKIKHKSETAAIGGAVSGFMAGLFGLGGAPRTAFLAALNLSKTTYIFTTGAAALLIDSSRTVSYYLNGVRLGDVFLWGLVFFIPGSFLGSKLAQYVVKLIPQKRFKYIIAAFLLLVSIKLMVFP